MSIDSNFKRSIKKFGFQPIDLSSSTAYLTVTAGSSKDDYYESDHTLQLPLNESFLTENTTENASRDSLSKWLI